MRPTKTAVIVWLTFALLVAGCGRTSPQTGRLIIKSEPSGAKISLNGKNQDRRTNAVFRLPAGTYRIGLLKAGSSASETPETGEAMAEVKPGETRRIVIGLNRMAVAHLARDQSVRPKTKGQKTIFDYCAALTAGDLNRAFAYLGPGAKNACGGLSGFTKDWKEVDDVNIVHIVTESYDSTTTHELNSAVLKVSRKAGVSMPSQVSRQSLEIITSENNFGGSGLPQILDIKETGG